MYICVSAQSPFIIILDATKLKQFPFQIYTTTAMDKKKGKPSQKTFEDHSFIKRSAKFVKKCKTCEFLEISREIHHE